MAWTPGAGKGGLGGICCAGSRDRKTEVGAELSRLPEHKYQGEVPRLRREHSAARWRHLYLLASPACVASVWTARNLAFRWENKRWVQGHHDLADTLLINATWQSHRRGWTRKTGRNCNRASNRRGTQTSTTAEKKWNWW